MRVGLIVPSSNTVMEPDFHRRLGSRHIVSTARIFLEQVTREAEIRMLEQYLPQAIDLIQTTAPDLVVFGCTSAGALGPLAHDDGIAERIAAGSGAKAVTVIQSVLAQLRSNEPRRLAIFTPYLEDLTAGVARSLEAGGYPSIRTAGMGIQENLDIGRIRPEQIVRFVETNIQGCSPDCIFLSCTNWRAMEAIPELESKLGVRVISSNQAAAEFVEQCGADQVRSNFS